MRQRCFCVVHCLLWDYHVLNVCDVLMFGFFILVSLLPFMPQFQRVKGYSNRSIGSREWIDVGSGLIWTVSNWYYSPSWSICQLVSTSTLINLFYLLLLLGYVILFLHGSFSTLQYVCGCALMQYVCGCALMLSPFNFELTYLYVSFDLLEATDLLYIFTTSPPYLDIWKLLRRFYY